MLINRRSPERLDFDLQRISVYFSRLILLLRFVEMMKLVVLINIHDEWIISDYW